MGPLRCYVGATERSWLGFYRCMCSRLFFMLKTLKHRHKQSALMNSASRRHGRSFTHKQGAHVRARKGTYTRARTQWRTHAHAPDPAPRRDSRWAKWIATVRSEKRCWVPPIREQQDLSCWNLHLVTHIQIKDEVPQHANVCAAALSEDVRRKQIGW